MRHRRSTFDRSAHRVAVVLDHEDHRDVEETREIHRLVETTLIERSITEEAKRDVLVDATVDDFILILLREGQTGSEWGLSTDDSMSTEEIVRLVEHVHRPALALRTAPDPTEHFSHAILGVHAASEGVPMIAVGGDDRIGMLHRRDTTDRDRFLANIDVAEATDLLVLVGLHGSNFELADQQHLPQPLMELLRRRRRSFGQRLSATGDGWSGVGHGGHPISPARSR